MPEAQTLPKWQYVDRSESRLADRAKHTAVSSVEPDKLREYTTLVVQPGNDVIWDVSGLVTSIKITFDHKTAYEVLEMTFVDDVALWGYLRPGNWITLYGPYYNNAGRIGELYPVRAGTRETGTEVSEYNEINRYQIVISEHSIGRGDTIEVHARDMAWLLVKNKIPYRLPYGSLTERLRFLEDRGYIELYEPLHTTDYELPATRGGTASIWDDIDFDLGETNRKTGKRYTVRQRKGKFYIQEISLQPTMWAFEVGANLMFLTLRRSIEQYFNTVYVIQNNDAFAAAFGESSADASSAKIEHTGFAIHQDDIPRMGQHILVAQEAITVEDPDAQIQADNLLQQFAKIQESGHIETFAMPGLRWGDQVLVYEPITRRSGVHWIKGGVINITASEATMSLDLALDYVRPEAVRSQQENASVLFEQTGVDPASLGPTGATDEEGR